MIRVFNALLILRAYNALKLRTKRELAVQILERVVMHVHCQLMASVRRDKCSIYTFKLKGKEEKGREGQIEKTTKRRKKQQWQKEQAQKEKEQNRKSKTS